MKNFYQYIEGFGINEIPDVFDILTKLSSTKLIDFAVKCHQLIEECDPHLQKDSFFNFSASTTISGGINPCSEIGCRLKNVSELSIFAALYSDSVLIPNFFTYIQHHHLNFKNRDQFLFFKNRILGDVTVLLYLKPIITAGVIQINPGKMVLCKDCLAKELEKEEKIKNAFSKLEEKISGNLIKNVKFILHDPKSIIADGPKNYIGTEVIRFATPPPKFMGYRKIPHIFKAQEIKKLKLYKLFINPIFNDLLLQKYSMWGYNLAYLTNRKIEAEIIDKLDQIDDREDKNKIIIDGLLHEIPFIQGADLNKLVNVRKKEEGAFITYRDAVRKTINEIKDEKSIGKAKQAVKDIIIPEVNKIDRIMKVHKDYFNKEVKKKVLFNSLIITAGFFANNLLGVDINAAIKAVGGLYLAKDLYNDVASLYNTPTEVKTSDYYFLWKLKQIRG